MNSEPFSVKLLPPNPVPATFVLSVMMPALARAAIMQTNIETTWTKRSIFIFCFLAGFIEYEEQTAEGEQARAQAACFGTSSLHTAHSVEFIESDSRHGA